MSMQLSQVVASRMNLQPALISPAYGLMLASNLRQLASADDDRENLEQVKARKDMLDAYGYSSDVNAKEFTYSNGVAFIPVTGLLINRFNRSWGYVTGYNYIRSMLNLALNDDDVTMIVLDCNSGGGEVAGCFELCADIRAARDVKPIVAVIDSASYSACYAVASSASKVVAAQSAGAGSIGVVAMHINMSKMLSEYGVEITFIYSGDHKVDGNPYEALPEPVRKSIQARVDNTRQEFVSLVAINRGLDTKLVFDTQAACYTASEALALGLIDAVASPLEAVQAYLAELSGSQTQMENPMDKATENAGTESTATVAAASTAVETAAVPAVKTDERAAERARIAGIQNHASAADKPALANHLALNTDLSVEAAAAIMVAAAPEKNDDLVAENATSQFSAAMETSDHPNVGTEGAGGASEMTVAQRILASQSLATGVKH